MVMMDVVSIPACGMARPWFMKACSMQFDRRPGQAGSIAPYKSRFSSMCPQILFRVGKPTRVLGAPGSTSIVMGVLQAILNVIEFDVTVTEAYGFASVHGIRVTEQGSDGGAAPSHDGIWIKF